MTIKTVFNHRDILAVQIPLDDSAICGIQQKRQRHLECDLHFLPVDPRFGVLPDEPNDRRYGIARDRWHWRQVANHGNVLGMDSDLLMSLTQGGVSDISIVWLHATTGETNLPGVVLQLSRTLRQHDGEPCVVSLEDWNKHTGRLERRIQLLTQTFRPVFTAGELDRFCRV